MTFTTIPAAGAKLRGATLSALITEVRPVAAYKSIDETVNNSATLQNDDELLVALEASVRYDIFLQLSQNSGATPGFKFSFTTPTGATWGSGWYSSGSSAANEQMGVTTTGAVGGITGAAANSILTFRSPLTTTNAGTLQLQWAQNTTNLSDTIVRSGGILVARRVS